VLERFDKDRKLYHSKFQIHTFIIRENGRDLYGMYKQALRELYSRESSLKTLYAQKLRAEIDMDELKYDIDILKESENPKDAFTLQRKYIEEGSLNIGYKDLKFSIEETEREFKEFYNIAHHLKDKLGDINEEELEEQFWVNKIETQMAKDYKTTGRIGADTMKLLSALPDELSLPIYATKHALETNPTLIGKFVKERSEFLNWDFDEIPNKLEKPVQELINGS
jgi:hypothetical protein